MRGMAWSIVAASCVIAAGMRPARTVADDAKPRSPEETLIELFVAMAMKDDAGILSVTVPNPEEGVLWEVGADRAPPEVAKRIGEELLKTVRRMHVGERVNLPGGREHVVGGNEITDDRLLLTLPDNPVPLSVVRHRGKWLVDAGTLIAARRAGLKPDTVSDWTNPVDGDKNLGDELRVATLRFRPPTGYEVSESKSGPAQMVLCQGKPAIDGTRPTLMLFVSPAQSGGADWSPERKLLRMYDETIASRRAECTREMLERGKIHGIDFARTRWRGFSVPTIKFPAPRPLFGVIYLATTRQYEILFLADDSAKAKTTALPLLEASLRTIHE